MFKEALERFLERMRGESQQSSLVEPPVQEKPDPYSDLRESIRLNAWWMEWPGHPGIVHPRCYAGEDTRKYFEPESQEPKVEE